MSERYWQINEISERLEKYVNGEWLKDLVNDEVIKAIDYSWDEPIGFIDPFNYDRLVLRVNGPDKPYRDNDGILDNYHADYDILDMLVEYGNPYARHRNEYTYDRVTLRGEQLEDVKNRVASLRKFAAQVIDLAESIEKLL